MSNSFYGGRAGQSFELAAYFNTKCEMATDLGLRLNSSVNIGDYVLIAYGNPNNPDSNFDEYKQKDLDEYGHSYNVTLWQKIYDTEEIKVTDSLYGIETFYLDETRSVGLGYRLCACLTGNTPKIVVENEELNADETPYAVVDLTESIDEPVITFYLPRSQVLQLGDLTVLDADQNPTFTYDETDVNYPVLAFQLPRSQVFTVGDVVVVDADVEPSVTYNTIPKEGSDTPNINEPEIVFNLPQSQILGMEELVVLDANEAPKVIYDDSNINKPTVAFELPQSQVFEARDLVVLDANEEPVFIYDDSDINKPTIEFKLPQSQVMDQPTVKVVNSATDPAAVVNAEDINAPYVEFELPRAVQFVMGGLLDSRVDEFYQVSKGDESTLALLDVGDRYINETNGFIFKVVALEEGVLTFQYEAQIQASSPVTTGEAVTPYVEDEDGQYVLRMPRIVSKYENEEEQTGWSLTVEVPTAPLFEADYTFCGPAETGMVTGAATGESSFTYSFTIPRGARLFSGTEVDDDNLSIEIEGAESGDVYLNADLHADCDGFVYSWDGEIWTKTGSIKGSVGKSLNIVGDYVIDTDICEDTLGACSSWLEAEHGIPTPEQLLAVSYFDLTDDNSETAYWYYWTETGGWGRQLITANTDHFIKTERVDDDDFVTYSVAYINSMIADEVAESEKHYKTYTAAAIDEMTSWSSF